MEVEIGDTVVTNPMDSVERSKLDHEEVSVEISGDVVVDDSEDQPITTAPNPFGVKSVIKSTEMALKAASDSIPAVIVTDENENELEHDEMGLNPIEDIDALQDILIKQNTHLCDTGLEKCLACSMIPEEFVEKLLCKTDKALCTCEMTDWMEKTTGYNLCGDEAKVLGADDDEARSVGASLIEDSVVGMDELDESTNLDESGPNSDASSKDFASSKPDDDTSASTGGFKKRKMFSLWKKTKMDDDGKQNVENARIATVLEVEDEVVENIEEVAIAGQTQDDYAEKEIGEEVQDEDTVVFSLIPWEDDAKNHEQKDIESSMIEAVVKNKEEAQEERNDKDVDVVATILPSETKSLEIEQDEACLKETQIANDSVELVEEKKVDDAEIEKDTVEDSGGNESQNKNDVSDMVAVEEKEGDIEAMEEKHDAKVQEEKTQDVDDSKLTIKLDTRSSKIYSTSLFSLSFGGSKDDKTDTSVLLTPEKLHSIQFIEPNEEKEEEDENGFECVLQRKLCFDDEKKVGSQYTATPPLTPVGPMETVENPMVTPSSEKKKFSRKALIRKLSKKLTMKRRSSQNDGIEIEF